MQNPSSHAWVKIRLTKVTVASWLICLLMVLSPGGLCGGSTHFDPTKKFDRAQTMLINLNHTKGSAGYYLLESDRVAKLMVRSLQKCINQVQEVEKTYGRSRGKPDDKVLATATLKISLAQQTAQQLDEQLRDAFQELKASIKDALILD